MKQIVVNRSIRKKKGVLTSHFHNVYEIYYLTEGHMRYIIADRIYPISKGDIVLIPQGVIHNTAYDSETASRLLVNFPGELIADKRLLECFDKSIVHASEDVAKEFEIVFGRLEKEKNRADAYSETLIRQYLTELLIIIARIDGAPPPPKLDGYSRIMQSAVEFINSSYQSEISLCSIAERFSLSKSFFSRKFKEVTGFGLSEYITLVRIKNAERMLDSTECSVTDIAFACGFNDSSYFTSTFKRIMGKTPLKYKKEIKNNGKYN
ncbi:MAG: helix-turn-helix domain-containing protein [Ruminococcaceae bacterium]|nr:helix-turn-helix domain-containing protein [Oscillospiraceae bacterium]